MSPSPYLGRCKNCDYALFTASEDIREADNAIAGGPAVNVGNGQIMGRCPHGHRWFPLRRIEGTYSPDHKCDTRCLSARGWKCTCSCGGANHGRGHVAAVIHVSAHETAPKAPKHIGEVGKYITGFVTVEAVPQPPRDPRKGLLSTTPYRFATDDGDKLVWFVQPEWDPGFSLGERLKIRARVKTHADHERFGKSTIVTYLTIEETE